LDSRQTDFLTAFIAASFPAEELRGLDVQVLFNRQCDNKLDFDLQV